MPLKPCRDCKQQISTEAESCPHCGRPTGNKLNPLIFLYLGMIPLGWFLDDDWHSLNTPPPF
jgi:hypothetical protein